jgi:hypothetical protein
LEKLGFRVERGKSIEDKIVVPVLFGRKGKILKCFNADAHESSKGWVLEVEARIQPLARVLITWWRGVKKPGKYLGSREPNRER